MPLNPTPKNPSQNASAEVNQDITKTNASSQKKNKSNKMPTQKSVLQTTTANPHTLTPTPIQNCSKKN